MRDQSRFQKIVRKSAPAAKLVLFLVVLLLANGKTARTEIANESSLRRERLTAGFYFTASLSQAAFPVRIPGGGVDLIVVDLTSGTHKRVISKGAKLLSPFLSADGKRLLVVRLQNGTEEYELLSCATANFVCRRLIATKDSINSPTEISANKVLYVASPLRVIPGVQSRHVQNDLWILEENKQPRQLTDFGFYQLGSLSPTRTSIYFSAIGPRRDKQIIPKFAPLASTDSDIFKLPFDAANDNIESPKDALRPLFQSGGRSTWASVSYDETVAAFLRTQTRPGGYRYDLVVTDLNTQGSRTFESTGLGFSRPVVIGRTVFVREIFDDRYIIRRLLPDGYSSKDLAEVLDASIDSTEPTEINLETEGR